MIPEWAVNLLADFGYVYERDLGTHGVRTKREGSKLDVWTNGSWKFLGSEYSGKTVEGLRVELEKLFPTPVIANLSAFSSVTSKHDIAEGTSFRGFYCTVDGVPYEYSEYSQEWTRIGFPEVLQ